MESQTAEQIVCLLEVVASAGGLKTYTLWRCSMRRRPRPFNPDVRIRFVPYDSDKDLMRESNAESSAEIRKRVAASRVIQSERFARTKIYCNAQMSSRHIKKHCQIDTASRNLLESAIDKLGLSAGAFNRIPKNCLHHRRSASGAKPPSRSHLGAIQYRNLDRKTQFQSEDP